MSSLVPKVIHVFPGLRPGGGPAGYAFYLRQALATLEGTEDLIEIVIPSGVRHEGDNSQLKASWKFDLVKKMPRWLAGVVLGVYTGYTLPKALRYFGFADDQISYLKQARVVVFHDYRLAFSYMKTHNPPSEQALFLMPHSPTDLSAEMVENWRNIFGESIIWKTVYEKLVELEFETMLRFKGIIAPCRSALEAYFRGFSGSNTFLRNLSLYEVKTGVPGLRTVQTRTDVRKRWGVAREEKIVGYFGRKHPHKGFDLFVQMAELAYERKYEDVWFVSAGRGPLPSPKYLPNYLDLGYLTEELADAVSAVDLVVVPNRFSYFDLFILEAMSLGKVVLTSRIGGNACFNAPGVLFAEELTAESFLQSVERLLWNEKLLEVYGRENKMVFEREYNLTAFANRHLRLAQTLLGGGH